MQKKGEKFLFSPYQPQPDFMIFAITVTAKAMP
jgi:hypothetical protein